MNGPEGGVGLEQPNKQAQWFEWIKMAMGVTQLGLSLVTPLVLLVLLAFWLRRTFSLGNWVVLAGLALGLASMGVTFYRIYRGILRQAKNKKDCLTDGEKGKLSDDASAKE